MTYNPNLHTKSFTLRTKKQNKIVKTFHPSTRYNKLSRPRPINHGCKRACLGELDVTVKSDLMDGRHFHLHWQSAIPIAGTNQKKKPSRKYTLSYDKNSELKAPMLLGVRHLTTGGLTKGERGTHAMTKREETLKENLVSITAIQFRIPECRECKEVRHARHAFAAASK